MNEKEKKHYNRLWQRILAVVCVVALIVSMFAFLSNISIEEEDGIGAQTLAKYDEYVNGSAAERAGYAASTLFSGDSSFEACYQQASVDIGKANYEDALENVEKCLDMCPEDAGADVLDDLWLKYGCLKAVLGAYDEALEGFANMTDDSAYGAEKELICAQIALERSDMDGAYVHLSAYVRLSPDDSSVWALYGDTCYYTQRFEDADDWYTKAQTAAAAFDASEYLLWGLCLMETNGLREAVSKFDIAVDNGYEDVGLCRSQAAICSYMLGEYESAVDYGTKALEADSDTVDYGMLVFYMGLSTFSMEQYEAAIAYLDSAEGLGCAQGELWFYRGFAKMMNDDPAAAVADYDIAAGFPALADSVYLYRGICYVQLEDLDAAVADLALAANSADEAIKASADDLLTQLDVQTTTETEENP